MQQQHMHGPHGHRHHFFLKFVFIFLVIGALFSFGNRGWGHNQQAAYWQGFQAGVASVASGAESATAPQVPPVAPFGPMSGGAPMTHGWGGPGFPVFFLLPFCGLALLAFMGFLFAISRGGRRRAWAHGGRGCWGEGKGPQAKPVTDDEVGPEKSPEDFL